MRYGFYLMVAALSLIAGWYAMRWYDSSPSLPTLEIPGDPGKSSAEGTIGETSAPRDGASLGTGESLPRFDIVRIAPDGSAVIAGRSAPGSRVVLYDRDAVLGEVRADGRGEWVFVPSEPLGSGEMILSLRSYQDDGRVFYSTDDVTIAIPEWDGQIRADRALVLARGGDSGVRPLQLPDADGLTGLSLDRIEYPDPDHTIYGGTAPPRATLRIYLDNRLLGDRRADDDGRWRLRTSASPAVGRAVLRIDRLDDAGTVRERIDRLDDAGTVRERIEVPFRRLAEGEIRIDPGQEYIIVGPGNSLWRIARRYYGRGIAYRSIHQANRDRIKNPDLIYPGQVFVAPFAEASSAESSPSP